MNQNPVLTNIVSMKILHLKIIHLGRFVCQLNIKIFNYKNISVYIKEFITNY